LRNRLLGDAATPDYSRSALPQGNCAVRLSGEIKIPRPDALAPFHLATPQERDRRVRDVLRLAWRIYRRGDVLLCDAIGEASGRGPEGEYAKQQIRRVLFEINLPAWEAHPNRSRDDIHRVFRQAISKLTPHRGGWRVAR
jgi:hypothetical protein